MATLYTHRESNTRKTWGLMLLFFLLIIAVGWALSYLYNSPEMLVIAVVVSIVMNITAYWYSGPIALSLAHAEPITREQYRDYWNAMENLCITAGLPMPSLHVINSPVPNAFATGRDAKHASVAVTTGLLGMLNKTELEGVLAHELSHIGNRDILLSTVIVVLVGLLAVVSDVFLRRMWLGGGSSRNKEGNAVLAVLSVVAIVLAPLAGTLLKLAVSRRREFLADASGALLTRYPEGLASALEKIGAYSHGHMKAGIDEDGDGVPDTLSRSAISNGAISHLFIANPLGSDTVEEDDDKVGLFSRLFDTHPPMKERIQRLRGEKQ